MYDAHTHAGSPYFSLSLSPFIYYYLSSFFCLFFPPFLSPSLPLSLSLSLSLSLPPSLSLSLSLSPSPSLSPPQVYECQRGCEYKAISGSSCEDDCVSI